MGLVKDFIRDLKASPEMADVEVFYGEPHTNSTINSSRLVIYPTNFTSDYKRNRNNERTDIVAGAYQKRLYDIVQVFQVEILGITQVQIAAEAEIEQWEHAYSVLELFSRFFERYRHGTSWGWQGGGTWAEQTGANRDGALLQCEIFCRLPILSDPINTALVAVVNNTVNIT